MQTQCLQTAGNNVKLFTCACGADDLGRHFAVGGKPRRCGILPRQARVVHRLGAPCRSPRRCTVSVRLCAGARRPLSPEDRHGRSFVRLGHAIADNADDIPIANVPGLDFAKLLARREGVAVGLEFHLRAYAFAANFEAGLCRNPASKSEGVIRGL